MGTHRIVNLETSQARAAAVRAVLEDLHALETMEQRGMLEDAARIGAEQEYLIVDRSLGPALVIEELMKRLADPRFTTELGRCNLEANLTPRELAGDCFRQLRAELEEVTRMGREAAWALGADLLLAGLLPTFELAHAGVETMTPSERYAAFARAAVAPRGGRIAFNIQGIDTLNACHDSILLEAASSSFQVHFQVAPARFAQTFNAALLTAAPVIAACANSALLAGRRLFHETRVPVLEASSDVRTAGRYRRAGRGRTSLGDGWVESSVTELYARDLARHAPVIAADAEESASQALREGRIPRLAALSAFNGTVWRWMRPCYGVTDGKPHLRIENRILPAGPSIADEIANAALWTGLMVAVPEELPDIPAELSFQDTEVNFHAAAREGLLAPMRWLGGKRLSARALMLGQLIPLARAGLRTLGVDAQDSLDLIEERVRSGVTGAAWMIAGFDATPSHLEPHARVWHVTTELQRGCWSGEPVHRWPRATQSRPRAWPAVASAMRTEFSAVLPDAPLELVSHVLRTEGTSHVVVETEAGTFAGMASLRALPGARGGEATAALVASDLVDRLGTVTFAPSTPIPDALQLLRAHGADVGVVLDGDLAQGVVLASDLLAVVASITVRSLPQAAERAEGDSDAGSLAVPA